MAVRSYAVLTLVDLPKLVHYLQVGSMSEMTLLHALLHYLAILLLPLFKLPPSPHLREKQEDVAVETQTHVVLKHHTIQVFELSDHLGLL